MDTNGKNVEKLEHSKLRLFFICMQILAGGSISEENASEVAHVVWDKVGTNFRMQYFKV